MSVSTRVLTCNALIRADSDIRAHGATTLWTCDYRHKNTEGCAGTLRSTNTGRAFLSQHLLSGLMYRSQGSIAALPAAINSLGLPDAQTVY